MTPERAEEIAVGAWRIVSALYAWNTQDLTAPLQRAILKACAEERADVLKNEFICAKCQLRQDSTREIKHEF